MLCGSLSCGHLRAGVLPPFLSFFLFFLRVPDGIELRERMVIRERNKFLLD